MTRGSEGDSRGLTQCPGRSFPILHFRVHVFILKLMGDISTNFKGLLSSPSFISFQYIDARVMSRMIFMRRANIQSVLGEAE